MFTLLAMQGSISIREDPNIRFALRTRQLKLSPRRSNRYGRTRVQKQLAGSRDAVRNAISRSMSRKKWENVPDQARSTPDAFATWVAMASISAGDRQSYGSSRNSFKRLRTADISLGGVPDSMMAETNAANSGGAQP